MIYLSFNDVLDFIVKHKEEIYAVVSILFFIGSLIFKKKPIINKLDTILKDVNEILPSLIDSVETPGNGSTKKNLVLHQVQMYLYKKYKFVKFEDIEEYVSNAIENILKTPQKKED